MSIVAPTREACPACGETVGSNHHGQIHPHQGRNGCTYSGNAHRFREIDPEAYTGEGEA